MSQEPTTRDLVNVHKNGTTYKHEGQAAHDLIAELGSLVTQDTNYFLDMPLSVTGAPSPDSSIFDTLDEMSRGVGDDPRAQEMLTKMRALLSDFRGVDFEEMAAKVWPHNPSEQRKYIEKAKGKSFCKINAYFKLVNELVAHVNKAAAEKIQAAKDKTG